jgi:small subunit ribosomal protein S3Ae
MASKGTTSRSAAKKIKDKWKMKEWYNIYSPVMFERKVVAESIASDPSVLIGRTVVTTLDTLPGEMKLHVKVKFRVKNVNGKDADTSFIGHEMTSDYVRRLARRKKTKIEDVFDVTTQDGVDIQMTVIGVADNRLQRSQERNVRNLCQSVAREIANQTSFRDYAREMVSGGLGKTFSNRCKVIYPLRRIEIVKSEITYTRGEPVMEPLPIEEAKPVEGTEAPAEKTAPEIEVSPIGAGPAEEETGEKEKGKEEETEEGPEDKKK